MRDWFGGAALVLGVAFELLACGKSSALVEETGGSAGAGGTSSIPDGLGAPCTTGGECSSGLNCTLGSCRTDCRTDADCPRGSLCSGTTQPYGCSLPSELDCESSRDCPELLTCGPDAKCRVGCDVSDDCPRNDHVCRTGVCVSNDDPDERWFACEDGETVCENYVTDTLCGGDSGFAPSCYRRMGCRLDGMDWGLIETCSPGPCIYQSDLDGRFSSSCQ